MILTTIQTHAAAFVIGAAVASGATWKVQGWMHDSEQLQAQEDVRETAYLQRKGANTAAIGHEADKTVIQTKFLTITEKVEHELEKIVYRDRVCLDADGVSALNEAIGTTGNSSKSENTLPVTTKPE